MTDDAMVGSEPKEPALKRFAKGLAEFFTPRDWVPTIPLPPVGRWEPKGKGTMTLFEAIEGFPESARKRAG